MRNWTHVIVHHTGAEEKDAAQVRRYHLSLGWVDIGYHYVVERDGTVVSGRSLSLQGAHCAAGGMNFYGIGVALLGNLENHPPLAAQRTSLNNLLLELCRRFNIPAQRVLGHREVPGAATACPGRNLDMAAVRDELAKLLAEQDAGARAGEPGEESKGSAGKQESAPGGLWRVQVGAFARKENAEALVKKLKAAGFDAIIIPPPL